MCECVLCVIECVCVCVCVCSRFSCVFSLLSCLLLTNLIHVVLSVFMWCVFDIDIIILIFFNSVNTDRYKLQVLSLVVRSTVI